jgi:hypothetical protein
LHAGHIRDELLVCGLLLAVAHANVRWPVSGLLKATDAAPTGGGGARATIPTELAHAWHRLGEHAGENVRLDLAGLDTELLPMRVA